MSAVETKIEINGGKRGADPDCSKHGSSHGEVFPTLKNSGLTFFQDMVFKHFLEGHTPGPPKVWVGESGATVRFSAGSAPENWPGFGKSYILIY